MNFTTNGGGAIAAIFAVISGIVTVLTAVFWIVVGWRAMRAHEQIAEVLRERLGTDPAPPVDGPR
mgnify:CR=1 FL=1